MRSVYLAVVLPLLYVASTASFANDYKVENGFFSLSGRDGLITSLRFDPAGKAHYGRNHIISLSVGMPVETPDIQAEVSGTRLILHGSRFGITSKIEQESADHAEQVAPGHTIGQTFIVEHGVLQSVEAHIPTWVTSDSAVTLKLYMLDSGGKTEVASRRAENLVDGAWVELKCSDQPAGRYLLELSDVKGLAGWWSLGKDVIPGEAMTDDEPRPTIDRAIRCRIFRAGSGDWEIKLDGNKLLSTFKPDAESLDAPIDHRIVTPWVKSGYDTTSDSMIFSHFLTNRGLYMPVHQFKRRPFSGVGGEWVLMSGRFGSDMKFTNANINLQMDEKSMTMVYPGGERDIEVLPHTDKLSEQFPVFYSSDRKSDKILNEFLLSHNFNFGVGTNPDWKDWHTLQLSWTANGQWDWQHRQFLDFKMDPNGYVYCWGGDPGWPFPFKDDDKDGVNDLDTRHFTTNPCFILGAWREYCWNPDSEYLAKLMPRVRSAMAFMLNEMDGGSGMLTIKAKGHEGKDGGIGSNYWDITPFGWKDAFTNASYYPCLEAMAQLEEAALRDPLMMKPASARSLPVHTPRFYRDLAVKARKAYNDTFWLADKGRYSGCVDVDGGIHDYGFTFVNLPAIANGLADVNQVKKVYNWMETAVTSSGKTDVYSRWVFAPRACTMHNPRRDEPQTPISSWWSGSWAGTFYDEQCQDGGAILYTSFHDIMARAQFLGADNAWKRLSEILKRYAKPDHLSGGSPLYYGETTQGGPGGTAGSIGVEGEFPESGLVPVSFLYAFMGVDADVRGLRIRPNLPKALSFAGVRNLRFGGRMYDIRVTNSDVEVRCTTKGFERTIKQNLKPGETFRMKVE